MIVKLEVNELKSGKFPYRFVLISVNAGTHMLQWPCCWLVDRGILLGFPGGPRNFCLKRSKSSDMSLWVRQHKNISLLQDFHTRSEAQPASY